MTNALAGLTPEQIQALTPETLKMLMNMGNAPAGGTTPAGDDLPDIDNATEGGNPRLCECTVDLEIVDMYSFKSTDPDTAGDPVFCANFKVVEVIEPGIARVADPTQDKDPPPWPVQVGEIRAWRAGTKPDAKGRPSKSAFRIRELVQAACRFVPSSKEADSAVDGKGGQVKWNEILKEAISEENPLAGKRVRATVSRIITRRGKGFAMYVPTFSLAKGVVARTTHLFDAL